jgi:hypothetical protein
MDEALAEHVRRHSYDRLLMQMPQGLVPLAAIALIARRVLLPRWVAKAG